MSNQALEHSGAISSLPTPQAPCVTSNAWANVASYCPVPTKDRKKEGSTSVKLQQGRHFAGGTRIKPPGPSPEQSGSPTHPSRCPRYPHHSSIVSLLPAPAGYSRAKHHPQVTS